MQRAQTSAPVMPFATLLVSVSIVLFIGESVFSELKEAGAIETTCDCTGFDPVIMVFPLVFILFMSAAGPLSSFIIDFIDDV